ncbi:MAG: MATE family efflux transporter, partial [Paludibacteraceae bacterium]|nr:MATE family efflux transporter [Paludibacteraceae bacterium]
MPKQRRQDLLLAKIRNGEPLTLKQQIVLTAALSLPAMLAQFSFILMEFIDASMVGHLGKEATGAIGLVGSTTWIFGGL